MKNKKQLGIYIHIPFCVRKCDYCDFLSGPANNSVKAAYAEALKCEIAHTAGILKRRSGWAFGRQGMSCKEPVDLVETGRLNTDCMKEVQPELYQVETIFIGGGTPTAVNAEFIAQILDEVRKSFCVSPAAEITIECNPGTLTREKADIYRSAGINRISFGLQSADDGLLRLIGRIHTWEDFENSFEIARAVGFENINVDIMSALPGQSLAGYVNGLERVLEYKPEHISAYSLILEEGTPLGDNPSNYPPVPDEDTEREMYYETLRLLRAYGYHRYEISNYAKQGCECRHNLSYWERKDYLGFGVGAASLFEGKRMSNIRSVDEYIRLMGCGRNLAESADSTESRLRAEVEALSREDAMSEFMFLGLRKTTGVSFADFAEQFGVDIRSVFGDALEENVAKGLLEYVDGSGNAVEGAISAKTEAAVAGGVSAEMEAAVSGGVSTETAATAARTGCRLTSRGTDVSNFVLADFLL